MRLTSKVLILIIMATLIPLSIVFFSYIMVSTLNDKSTFLFYAITAIIIALVMVIVLAFVVSNSISKPIVELSMISERVSMGELETEVPHQDRDDEIGLLAKSIERLRRSLKIAIDSLEEALR